MSKFLAVILSYWKAIDKSLGEFRHVPSITRTKMMRNICYFKYTLQG